MNKLEVFELMIEIKRNFTAFDVSDEEVDRYYKHLNDFPFEVAIKNLNEYVKTNTYPPKIADIRGRSNDLTERQKLKQQAIEHQKQLDGWLSQDSSPPPGYWERIKAKLKGDQS